MNINAPITKGCKRNNNYPPPLPPSMFSKYGMYMLTDKIEKMFSTEDKIFFLFSQISLQFYTLTISHILQVANFTCY